MSRTSIATTPVSSLGTNVLLMPFDQQNGMSLDMSSISEAHVTVMLSSPDQAEFTLSVSTIVDGNLKVPDRKFVLTAGVPFAFPVKQTLHRQNDGCAWFDLPAGAVATIAALQVV